MKTRDSISVGISITQRSVAIRKGTLGKGRELLEQSRSETSEDTAVNSNGVQSVSKGQHHIGVSVIRADR